MDKIISELESLLPGKPPKFVLAISILLSVALYNMPVYDILADGIERVELRALVLRLLLAGCILLIGFVTLTFILAYHNKKISAQKSELKSTLDVVSTDAQKNGKTVKSLQSQLASNAHELDTLKKQNTEYFYQVSSLNTDKTTLQTLLDEARNTVAELNKKLGTIEQEHNAKIDKINTFHVQQSQNSLLFSTKIYEKQKSALIF